jgi:hypothetical protein
LAFTVYLRKTLLLSMCWAQEAGPGRDLSVTPALCRRGFAGWELPQRSGKGLCPLNYKGSKNCTDVKQKNSAQEAEDLASNRIFPGELKGLGPPSIPLLTGFAITQPFPPPLQLLNGLELAPTAGSSFSRPRCRAVEKAARNAG